MEAAHLAGHQNHHQKIHYMEKLKQQNIELTEVCTKTGILTVPEQRVVSTKTPRNLRDKIKYFEMLKEHRQNDVGTQSDARGSGKKRSSLGSVEILKKEDRREQQKQMQARRSSDCLASTATRKIDSSFLVKNAVTEDKDSSAYIQEFMNAHGPPAYDALKVEDTSLPDSQLEEFRMAKEDPCDISTPKLQRPCGDGDDRSWITHGVDKNVAMIPGTAWMSPLDYLLSTVKTSRLPVSPVNYIAVDDTASVTSTQNLTPSASVVSLAKEATKAASIINANITDLAYQCPPEMPTPENYVKLDDSPENSSPFILVQDKILGIVVDEKKAQYEDKQNVHNLHAYVDELTELEPGKHDVEESNEYLREMETKNDTHVLCKDWNLNKEAMYAHYSPQCLFSMSPTDCRADLCDEEAEGRGLNVDPKSDASSSLFDVPFSMCSPVSDTADPGVVKKIKVKFQDVDNYFHHKFE